MKTAIKKTGDTIVVSMDGRLDFETTIPLREDLNRLIRQTKTDTVAKKIIFNLEKLDFVGSSGISSFVQTLKDFNNTVDLKPKYCHVKTEFQKIIKAFDESEGFEFHDNEERAKRSFDC
jgi:anti-anti-sigma factor